MKKSNFFYAVLAILSSVLSAAEEKISLEVLINKKQELKITRTEEEKLAWENLTDKTFSNLEVSQVHIDTVSPEHAITLIQEVQGIKSLELDHMQITPDLWNAIAKKAATLEKLDISWPKTLPKEIPPLSEGLWQVTLYGNIDSASIFVEMKTFKQVISALPKTVTSLTISCPFLFPLKEPLKTSVALFENFPNTIKQLTLHDYNDLTQEQASQHLKAIANTCPGLREINFTKVNQLKIDNHTKEAEWKNLALQDTNAIQKLTLSRVTAAQAQPILKKFTQIKKLKISDCTNMEELNFRNLTKVREVSLSFNYPEHANIDSVLKQTIKNLPTTVTDLHISYEDLSKTENQLDAKQTIITGCEFEELPKTVTTLVIQDAPENLSQKVCAAMVNAIREKAPSKNLMIQIGKHRFKPLKVIRPSAYYWIAGAIGLPVACYLAYRLLGSSQKTINPILEQNQLQGLNLLQETDMGTLIPEKTTSAETSLKYYLPR